MSEAKTIDSELLETLLALQGLVVGANVHIYIEPPSSCHFLLGENSVGSALENFNVGPVGWWGTIKEINAHEGKYPILVRLNSREGYWCAPEHIRLDGRFHWK